jgi:arabinofuranan 3-O-arabinosyltransferase
MLPIDMYRSPRPLDGTRRSLRLLGFALTLNCVLFLAASLFVGQWLIDRHGRLVDSDFVDVWAAGKLALGGQPAAAYDWAVHREVEVEALGHDFHGNYGWHYPPTFLFVAAALAMFPYLVAMLLWIVATLSAYLAAIRLIIGERLGILLGCAFPGVMWNISVGQNGFLTAALIGFMLVNMTTRPIVSGVLLGLLTYKPQFGILFPLVLACDGRWRVIAAAAVTSVTMVAASIVAFGFASWRAFFEWLPVTSATILGDGRSGLNKLQSLFGAVRWLGGGTTAAWIAQGLLIAGVTVALVLLLRSRVRDEIKAAALALGTLLATPYAYIYDFPVLMISLAFLLRLGLRDGFLPYELSGMVVACCFVLVFPILPVPTGFAAAIVVAAIIARRVIAHQSAYEAGRLPSKANENVTASAEALSNAAVGPSYQVQSARYFADLK